jgi:hypothetical protein
LVGDAGDTKDPTTAQGISDAFRLPADPRRLSPVEFFDLSHIQRLLGGSEAGTAASPG